MKKEQKKEVKRKKSKGIQMWMVLVVIALIVIGIIVLVQNNNKKQEVSSGTVQTDSKKEGYVEEIEDGVKINKSSKLNEAKEIDGLTITNIQLTTKDGMTTLLADVTNNSGASTAVRSVQITLLKQDGSELVTVTGIIDKLDVGGTTQLNIAMTSNYIEAYDFEVK